MRQLRRILGIVERAYNSSLIWYALLLALIGVVVIIALIVIGPVTSQIFQDDYCLQCT